MSDLESTISQSKNNCALNSASGLQRRAFPELEEEIGFEPAALLLQLDYWIGNRGFEQDGQRWFRISAKNISAWAFPTWSQRKVQRLTKTLQEAGLILVEYFDGPYTTPYIALNLSAIAEKLKSLRIVDESELTELPAETPSPAPVENQSNASTPMSKASTFPPMTATPSFDNLDHRIDAPSVTVDALPSTAPSIPPSTAVTTYKDQLDSVSTEMAGVPSEKTSEKRRKISAKRESARSADVSASRATSSLNEEKQAAVGTRFPSTKKSAWDAFCEKLAEICGVDFDLEPGYIRAYASKLWKKGEGYTLEDLEDFDVWWNNYDYRGVIRKTRPVPKQVCECIRQSCEHEHTQLRHYVREIGYSPDDEEAIARYRYIFGENASYIKY